jgi:hypothetical protein
LRNVTNSFSTACGVSTEVGSSRISSFGFGHQRAHDLDPLALADREGVHGPQRIDVEPVDRRDLDDALRHFGQRQGLVEPEPDVLGRGQRVEQAEVLEHHADPERPRLLRIADRHRLPVPADLALVGTDCAVDHLHHGRLAGAVLAEHGVDLAGLDAQRDVVVGFDSRVLFADVDQL